MRGQTEEEEEKYEEEEEEEEEEALIGEYAAAAGAGGDEGGRGGGGGGGGRGLRCTSVQLQPVSRPRVAWSSHSAQSTPSLLASRQVMSSQR